MVNDTLKTYWHQSSQDVFSALGSQPTGLSDDEAVKRHAAHPLTVKKENAFLKDAKLFLSQFKSPLVLLLVAAVILSGILGEKTDVIIIMTILLLTNIVSFLQERNAGRAVEKLRAIIKVKAKVLRSGVAKDLETDEIIPGDVILFSAGDLVPADCLLFEGKDIHANEAALTGETYPAEKEPQPVDADAPLSKRKNVLFQGTSIVSGQGKAVVVNIGADTVFGQISKEINTTSETAFEKGIRKFGYLLMKITIVLAVVILGINIYFGKPLMDSVLFALALTVGMAPELLPAIMTVAMSSGAKRMAEVKVIVKKLPAIQNLGEVNILCSDKTGTLTEGVITVSKIVDANGAERAKAKLYTFLNASFESGFVNPIDEAIRSLKDIDITGYTKADEVPYDFQRKRLTIVVSKDNKHLMITKGALSNILDICNRVETGDNNTAPIESVRAKIEAAYQQYSDQGFRTIGVCYKDAGNNPITAKDETQMIFAGFVLLFDPPKEGVKEIIQRLNNIGVTLKVITGDNRLVAAFICKQIGLHTAVVMAGDQIGDMNADELAKKIGDTNIFAEIEPNQKERIIQALQKNGNAVAYIGDGINDVAAIHAADAGISVNNAVDVAKEAADIVLLEKDLGVLEKGIVEGRKTFMNTLKYIYINTSATFGNMFSMAGASLILPFLPLLPKQILATNFLTDFPYIFVASDNVDEEVISRPQKWDNKFIRNFMLIFGFHSSIFDYLTFYVLYKVYKSDADHFRTGWFVESILTELLILFVVRTHKSFIKSKPGKALLIASVVALLFTIALPYSPLASALGLVGMPSQLFAVIIGITLAYALTAEVLKRWYFRKNAS